MLSVQVQPQPLAPTGTITFLRESLWGGDQRPHQQCSEHLQMVQDIQLLLSDQVSQDLLHFPRDGESKEILSMNICRSVGQHLGGKDAHIFQIVHAEGKNCVMV